MLAAEKDSEIVSLLFLPPEQPLLWLSIGKCLGAEAMRAAARKACNRFVHAEGSDSTELTSSVSMYSLISHTLPSLTRMTKQYALL